MKKLYILMLALLCLTVATCKKDVEPYVFNADIKVTDIKTNMAVIEAINEEEGFDRLEAVVLCSADEKVKEPKQYKMTYEDEAFKANVYGLLQDTKYYYKIIFTGKYNSVETEVSSFETEKIVLPVVKTVAVTEVMATRATCGGNVSSDGGGTIIARGVCWSTNHNPTIEDNKTTNGSGTGNFTSSLSNLASQTTYYVRAYATNEAGTAYGEEKIFTTQKKAVSLPDVLKTTVSNVTSTTAVFGSGVFSDGGGTVSARGFCWSCTTETPTITDSSFTTNGSGLGSFSADVTGLKASTQYYVRAYATNEAGTAYGEIVAFYTSMEEQPEEPIILPTVTTAEVTNITSNSATCGGNVTSDGNGTVSACGICWSTSPNPTIADNKTTDGSGIGSFTSSLSNLASQTTYYVRAYATNEKGTSYGKQKSFTTRASTGTENGYGWIDLGLSVKWATCNVGADSPEAYGDYFAWGEITTKTEYTEDNSLTYGKQMNDISGNPQYDAATANWGGEWRMPTKAEQEELLNNCTWTWTTQNGVNGYNVEGPNGNSIFLPAAGCRYGSSLSYNGSLGGYWSSTSFEYYVYDAYYLDFISDDHRIGSLKRYGGESVRPVFGGNFTGPEEQPEEPIVLPTVTTAEVTNITSNAVTCGGNVTSDGNATVTSRGICWSTSPNPTIDDNKTTDGSGTGSYTSYLSNLASQTTYYVRAYATNEAGTAYGEEKSFVTLGEEAEETISGTENGHNYVDLGLPSGLKWATCNVGADSPEEYGDYYAWGETSTKETYDGDNCPTYGLIISQLQSQGYIDGEGNLTAQYDAAAANWGGNWRMPTEAEMQELENNCIWTWTTQNGVNGYSVEGPNGNSIFLPAAGYRLGSSLDYAGSGGVYWSSTPGEDSGNYACGLYFFSSSHGMVGYGRHDGLSVRPILE